MTDTTSISQKTIEFASGHITLATDLKQARSRIVDISIEQQISVLRDSSALSLAGLGAIVTILTVASARDLVNIPALFYLAAAMLILCLIYCQWARERLITYHADLRLEHELEYAEIKGAANALIRDPDSAVANAELVRVTQPRQQKTFAPNKALQAYKFSYKIAITGLLLLSASLVLTLTLPL